MWNLKKKTLTKQKQTHRYREQIACCQMEWGRGMGEKGEEVEKYKLPVTEM